MTSPLHLEPSSLEPASPPALQGGSVRGESGVALLITVLMMLLLSAIGITAIDRASDEAFEATASRRGVTNVSAADAALRSIESQLFNSPVPPSILPAISDPAFSDQGTGHPIAVRTGTIGDPTPAAITAECPKSLGSDFTRVMYRVSIVATDPSGGQVEVQAQYSVRDTNGFCG